MKLTQKQRNEIRYALEDCGVPEVLAFMAARNATIYPVKQENCHLLGGLFFWTQSPEGHEFWQMAAAQAQQCFLPGGPVPFPELHSSEAH